MARIVIAGFGSAGYAALMAARKTDLSAELIVVDPKEKDLFHPCGLPYCLEGIVPREGLQQNLGLDRMKVKKLRGRVTSILPQEKAILADCGAGNEKISYDRLIISTGSSPIVPPLSGARELLGRGLHTLASMSDLTGISEKIHREKKGIVIGAGAIGLESAVALMGSMAGVNVLEMKPNVLAGVLDSDMAGIVEDYCRRRGIKVLCGSAVSRILGEESFAGVYAGEEELVAELGILSTGFRANSDLAGAASLKTGRFGISVSSSMSTSIEDIYAAGDCAEGWSVLDGKPVAAKLATSAYKQGLIAGTCAAGGKAEYRGTAGTFVTKIGELEVAGTGFSTEMCGQRGFEAASGKIKTRYLPDYFPGGDEISVKVIADKNSGRILGGQAVGASGAASRVNIISMAIEFDLGLEDLKRAELAYCPAVSEVEDPLFKAVDFCLRRMK
jgi:NADH oxidase (H2O2-forming)